MQQVYVYIDWMQTQLENMENILVLLFFTHLKILEKIFFCLKTLSFPAQVLTKANF